jgi:cob(I)alamin adenosyltransferase
MKIYTKKGDDGTTGLLYGGRIPKSDPRTEAYGTSDEAVAAIGIARSAGPKASSLEEWLLQVQRELFVLGAELATAPENIERLKPGVSKVTEEMVTGLESEMDRMSKSGCLPEYFVVPGACDVSAALDLARAIVRRCERLVVALDAHGELADRVVIRYLNRLSDFLFVAARYEEHERGISAPPSRADRA